MCDLLSSPKQLMPRLGARFRSWRMLGLKRVNRPCPLLEVPAELRLLIYENLYDDTYCGLIITKDLRLIRAYYGNGKPSNLSGKKLPLHLTALLRTCKLIFKEAAPVFNRNTIFCIHRIPHLDDKLSRRLPLTQNASAMFQYMRRGYHLWGGSGYDTDLPQAQKYLGYAMAPNPVLHSAQRVVLSFATFEGDEVDEVAALITKLISILNAHEHGLLECGIDLSSASSSPGDGDVVLRAFSAIKCQKRVRIIERLWITDYYSDEEWEGMLSRLNAVEIKTKRMGRCLRITVH